MTNAKRLHIPAEVSKFSADELVFAGVENGPRISQNEWDLRSVSWNQSAAERVLYLAPIVGSYRETARELLLALAQPNHPVLVAAGVISPSSRASVRSLLEVAGHMKLNSEWGTQQGLLHVKDWKQTDVEALLSDLASGRSSPTGRPLGPSALRKYITTLKDLREFDSVLTGGGFTFMPWGATPASTVSKSSKDRENKTPVMPLSMWMPLMRAAWTVVSEFAEDIIASSAALRDLPKVDHGIAGHAAWPALQVLLSQGYKIPLHTGMGRGSGPRGAVNRSLMFRLAGINSSFLKPTHHSYNAQADEELKTIAKDSDSVAFGGLYQPTALVTHADGSSSTWIEEIGPGEALYLPSVLRAACYIMIAGLTGMRDSEIQELRKGCISRADGLDAITSIQSKGVYSEIGEVRTWWVISAVLTAVRVLERLSPNETYLFARSPENLGPYSPTRDIRRFTDFINSDFGDRCGRGRGLGLDRIDLSSGTPITQMTLRRSYSVIAAQNPGAEIGLGINLGHSALRTTSPYAMDSAQRVAQMFNEERRTVVRNEAMRVIGKSVPVSGVRSGEIAYFRGQVAIDDTRAASIIDAFADTYEIGVFNDCMYQPERAACGAGGPKLASSHCATSACSNALFLERHAPTLRAQIEGIDAWLKRGLGHPAVLEQLKNERARLIPILEEIEPPVGDFNAE